MDKSIVVTVGTSLLSEAKGIITNELRKLLDKNHLDLLETFQQNLEKMILEDNENILYAVSVLKEKWNVIQDNPAGIEGFRALSAELASLARFDLEYPLNQDQDQIHLICSDSHSGWLSGRLLQLFLKDNVVDETYLHPIDGLKARNERMFKDTGLRNLVDKIADLSRQEEKEVFIIATGGYKAGSVYGSLAGMLCQRPIYYLHEEFQENIDLPVLPINLDFDLWRQNAERIELILNLPVINAKPFYEILDDRIRNLIQLNDAEDSYVWKPAGEILYSAYKDASVWSQFQAGGRSLLFHLRKEDLKSRYGRYLQEISEYIWIGDKVPEMVDHALKHHHNLFEFAEMFLVPMFLNNPDFMSPEEVYVLLCVILLHDCGHSLNAFPGFPGRPLLPTEIRNWHHILGYERLNPDHFRIGEDNLLPELAFIWKENQNPHKIIKEYWEDELKAIATIGLYHRRDMPLKNGEEEYNDYSLPTKKKSYAPLSSEKLFFHGKEFTESALKLASIFRIIDSCDIQISRIGTDQEQRLKLGLIAADLRTETKREENATELLSLVTDITGITQIRNELEKEVETARELYRKKERREFKDNEEKEKLKGKMQNHRESVNNIINSIDKPDKQKMIQMAVDLRREVSYRLDFKKEQEAHFSRAAKIKEVSVAHNLTDSMNKFVVIIKGSSKDKEYLEELKNNMMDEYERVKSILFEYYNMTIDYELDLD
ncbi:putative CRISPR-associated protein [Candidatus Poribacteria bacterium]|nr:putative CRISPR-associated protein [Candidatus Poribacteria bacterium]